jgi:hypothetical protein
MSTTPHSRAVQNNPYQKVREVTCKDWQKREAFVISAQKLLKFLKCCITKISVGFEQNKKTQKRKSNPQKKKPFI